MEVSTSGSSGGEKEAMKPERGPFMSQVAAAAEVEMEEVFNGGEPSSSSALSSSTNWVVAGGSLRDSIAFDTSESIAGPDDNLACPKGSVVLKAPGDEPPPCEVNVCFSQKHEIYRVYVKSTARVFEMYHAPEEPIKDNEYLCTVHCGVAGETSLPELDAEGGLTGANLVPETMSISPTNNSNDEDGWVEVKIADSPVVGYSDMTFYEATAEITDVNPCISLTLRLLSLHDKGSVQIAEIYICADPLPNSESSCTQFSMSDKFAGSSLLSMFVPGLFPLQKLDNSRREIFDKFRSGAVGNEKCSLDLHRNVSKESNIQSQISAKIDVQTPFQASDTPLEGLSSQHVPHSGETNKHVPQHVPPSSEANKRSPEGNEIGYSHIESILLKLVSRVDAVENICLRLEEKMMKPLSSMETRLGQVEQQLGVLIARSTCPEQLPSSRIAAPEFSCDTSETGENGENEPSVVEKETSANSFAAEDLYASSPGLVVRAPEFVLDDESHIGCNDNSWLRKKPLDDLPTAVAENRSVEIQNEGIDSTINLQEDAAILASTHSLDDDFVASGDVSDLKFNKNGHETGAFSVDTATAVSECSVPAHSVAFGNVPVSTGNKNSNDTRAFSVDCALTAALEAFMFSSLVEPSKDNSQADKFQDELDNHAKTNQTVSPAESLPCRSNIQQLFSGKIGGKGITDFISFGVEPSHGEGEKGFGSNKPSENSADETTSESQTQSEKADGTNEHLSDHDIKSYSDENHRAGHGDKDEPNLEDSYGPPLHKNWIGESSSDSLVEGITTDHSQVIWSDGSSSYSEEEVFPLPKWLAGRLGSLQSQMETSGDTGCDSYSARNIGVSAVHDFSKSSMETCTEPDPVLDYKGSILDVKFCSEKVCRGSYFQDLLGETSTIETGVADYKESDQDAESVSWNSSSQCAVDLSDLNYVDHQPLVDIAEAANSSEAADKDAVNQVSSSQANQEPFPSLI